jgi:hypothetical protein
MATVTVKTAAPATALSPIARVLRTVLQTVIAFGAAMPTLIGALGLTGTQAAKVSGIVAGLVLVASSVQNLLEHFNVIPTSGATAAAPTVATRAPVATGPVVSG